MGEVWEATDGNLNRAVAVKFVTPSLLRDAPHLASLLKDEAGAAFALFNHPAIVAILDLVEQTDISVRVPFLVMECLAGSDGRTFAKQRLTCRKDHLTRTVIALYAILRAAKGLMHAHENSVVHRDIKPGNILIGYNGVIKLTDFDLAKIIFEATRAYTTRHSGTLFYSAPEQASGAPASAATDIYQLGCSLYEMLDGQAPFEEKANHAALLQAKLNEPEPDPTNMGGLIESEKRAILESRSAKLPFLYRWMSTLARLRERVGTPQRAKGRVRVPERRQPPSPHPSPAQRAREQCQSFQ